jgi:hypothetical protein
MIEDLSQRAQSHKVTEKTKMRWRKNKKSSLGLCGFVPSGMKKMV